jgi:ornithine--oxo-acid transaminase
MLRRCVSSLVRNASTLTSAHIDLTERFAATTYKPLSVVISRARGCIMWDVDGREYYDFLSAYSAVNQGHCHPRLVKVLSDQAHNLTLTSRAFYNDKLGPFSEYITRLFGYDRVLPMNTGVEGGESAIKLARKWAYEVKGVPDGKGEKLFDSDRKW